MELQKKDLGKVRGNLVRGGKGVNTPSSAKHLRSSASCFAFPTVLQSRLKLTLEKKRKGEVEETERFGERTLRVGRKAGTISLCVLGN